MKRNMGQADRVIRSAVAAGAVALIASGAVKGAPAIATAGLATIFVLTGILGHCPVYAAAGINSLPAPGGDTSG